MIDKNTVLAAVESAIADTDLFVVDVEITPAKEIYVDLDAPHSLDIDTIAALSEKIASAFPEDEIGEYDLTVGSAGLTAPFKVRGQWLKNIGSDIELYTTDGRKLACVLTAVGDNDFTVAYSVKDKPEGAKRPQLVEKTETIPFDKVKRANCVISF